MSHLKAEICLLINVSILAEIHHRTMVYTIYLAGIIQYLTIKINMILEPHPKRPNDIRTEFKGKSVLLTLHFLLVLLHEIALHNGSDFFYERNLCRAAGACRLVETKDEAVTVLCLFERVKDAVFCADVHKAHRRG